MVATLVRAVAEPHQVSFCCQVYQYKTALLNGKTKYALVPVFCFTLCLSTYIKPKYWRYNLPLTYLESVVM